MAKRISYDYHTYSKKYKDIKSVEEARVIKVWSGHKTEVQS